MTPNPDHMQDEEDRPQHPVLKVGIQTDSLEDAGGKLGEFGEIGFDNAQIDFWRKLGTYQVSIITSGGDSIWIEVPVSDVTITVNPPEEKPTILGLAPSPEVS